MSFKPVVLINVLESAETSTSLESLRHYIYILLDNFKTGLLDNIEQDILDRA